MKTKFKDNIISLAKSTINNKVLFERRKNSFLAPLIIFVLSVFMMFVPPFLSFRNTTGNELMKNFPNIEEALTTLLTSSLDCKIEDAKLVCAEGSEEYNVVVGENVKYTILVNQPATNAQDTTVTLGDPKDSDNLISLSGSVVRIRYITRDLINSKINSYEIIGTYSKLEGYSFKEIATKLAANPELIQKEIEDFMLNVTMSTMGTRFKASLYNSFIAIFLFVIVSSFIIKGPSLLKWKKGFKFSECLKISLTSSLPALLIASLFYFVIKYDFSLLFGIIYLVRIVYIYIKYILSNKNSIYAQIYDETKDERFNMK